MKVLITGDRNWDDIELIAREFESLPQTMKVVHGCCRGAAQIAGLVAQELGMRVLEYPADWSKGRGAGYARNQHMLDREHTKYDPIVLCIAFHDNIESSRETRDMIDRAGRCGIPVKLIKHQTREVTDTHAQCHRHVSV